MTNYKVYQVGGCVRDRILGREPSDYDYLVVGGTPEDLLSRGFEQVGASFPVFLDPNTKEEYALARRERKTSAGYHGFEVDFAPTVTIEEDLHRRDFSFNSMAYDMESDVLIDPYGGCKDIANRVIRHTSDAFSEDPLRILRAFRFAVRFGFSIHPDTKKLIESVVHTLDEISPSRLVAEICKLEVDQLKPFVQYCLRYDLHKKTNVFRGLYIPPAHVYCYGTPESILETIGAFWDVPDDFNVHSSLVRSSRFNAMLRTLSVKHTTAEELHDFIKRFRLTKENRVYHEKFLNNVEHGFIRQASSVFADTPIPVSEHTGLQLKADRISRIQELLDRYNGV